MIYHRLIIFSICSLIVGCTVTQKKSTDATQDTVTIRKHIKDVDYRVKSESVGFKKRVLVLPFVDKIENSHKDGIRDYARSEFIEEIVKLNNVNIVLLENFKINLDSMKSNQEYNLKKIAQLAEARGFNSIIEGQVIDLRMKNTSDQIGIIRDLKTKYEVVVRLRVVNVRTENEVFNTIKTVTLEETNQRIVERVAQDKFFMQNPELVKTLIKDAFVDFAPQITSALTEITWEGRIAAIREDKIYLNVGKISGVQIGDLLKVVESGSEIYDPEIGYHLGLIRGKTKGTLEVISYFGQDGAVAVVHSGAAFKESDRVETYQ